LNLCHPRSRLLIHRYEQNLGFAAKYANRLGAHALLFNYRGVSESAGWPSTARCLVDDGRAAIEYVTRTFNTSHESLLLHGHSMGGGVIGMLAESYPE
jgi:alpha/beta superfamily hydrolase